MCVLERAESLNPLDSFKPSFPFYFSLSISCVRAFPIFNYYLVKLKVLPNPKNEQGRNDRVSESHWTKLGNVVVSAEY